jgi:hypothetical protein
MGLKAEAWLLTVERITNWVAGCTECKGTRRRTQGG